MFSEKDCQIIGKEKDENLANALDFSNANEDDLSDFKLDQNEIDDPILCQYFENNENIEALKE